MNANEWIPLVDKLAEKLGVASGEVAQAVEVLAADYRLSCWVAIGLALLAGVAISTISFAVRRKAKAIVSPHVREDDIDENVGVVRIGARIAEGLVWLFVFLGAAQNAVALPMARLHVLKTLLSGLK